jgi:hypothetical protein
LMGCRKTVASSAYILARSVSTMLLIGERSPSVVAI